MTGKRAHPAFKLTIGQLTLNFEVVTNKGISKLVRLLPASKFEEVKEAMNSPRRKLRHGRETPRLRL